VHYTPYSGLSPLDHGGLLMFGRDVVGLLMFLIVLVILIKLLFFAV
jgi:hypothetical protein